RSAIGEHLALNIGSGDARVVGVVRHLKVRDLLDPASHQVFVPWPIAQRNPSAWIVATSGDPAAIAAVLKDVVETMAVPATIYDVQPLAMYVDGARASRRFTMLLGTVFAAVALVLACIGMYGVLAYAVAHRRHEFGVRRALGANRAHIMRLVFNEGLSLTSAGCLAGCVGAFLVSRLWQSQMPGAGPGTSITYLVAIA